VINARIICSFSTITEIPMQVGWNDEKTNKPIFIQQHVYKSTHNIIVFWVLTPYILVYIFMRKLLQVSWIYSNNWANIFLWYMSTYLPDSRLSLPTNIIAVSISNLHQRCILRNIVLWLHVITCCDIYCITIVITTIFTKTTITTIMLTSTEPYFMLFYIKMDFSLRTTFCDRL
jgi:hypothetical protein